MGRIAFLAITATTAEQTSIAKAIEHFAFRAHRVRHCHHLPRPPLLSSLSLVSSWVPPWCTLKWVWLSGRLIAYINLLMKGWLLAKAKGTTKEPILI
jgi:hypothetical protein